MTAAIDGKLLLLIFFKLIERTFEVYDWMAGSRVRTLVRTYPWTDAVSDLRVSLGDARNG